MPTIGVDYSADTAYIGVADAIKAHHVLKVVYPGSTGNQRREFFTNLILTFKSLVDDYQCDKHIYIEKPWVSGMKFPQVALKLVRMATFIELAALCCEGYDLDPIFIGPSSWRKAVYGHGNPQDPKGTAIGFADEKLGWKAKFKNQHNEAEALIIAHYGNLYGVGHDYI